VRADGVLYFDYEDSFSNKGTGTFRPLAKGGYALSIHITDVRDSRCLTFYGDVTLQRNDARDRQRLADELQQRRFDEAARAAWPEALEDFPMSEGSVSVVGFKITTKDTPDQGDAAAEGRRHEFVVENLKTGRSCAFSAPSVGLRILKPAGGWPQLEVWSRRGGSEFRRSLYTFRAGRYECLRQDRFTRYVSEAGPQKLPPATVPGRDDALYFMVSQIPPQE